MIQKDIEAEKYLKTYMQFLLAGRRHMCHVERHYFDKIIVLDLLEGLYYYYQTVQLEWSKNYFEKIELQPRLNKDSLTINLTNNYKFAIPDIELFNME